ncbi:MAG: ATP-binding protein [Desulfitobacterium hafniense]|nr:ATP-binding protein [Desulfitobacterium hafniense]
MSIKWRLTGLFCLMTTFSLLLFWVGASAVTGSRMLPVNLPLVVLAIVLPGSIVYIYVLTLSRRIERLNFTARKLAQGSFEEFNFEDSSDELGQLAIELSRLARQIENIIQKGTQEAQKIQAILKSMQEGVIALDHVGRIVLVNRAAEHIFGRPQEDVQSKYLIEMVRDSKLDDLVSRVLAGGQAGSIELLKAQRIVLTQVSPIIADNGRTRGAVIVGHDVTELRRLEQVRTEFVANVSHELRTPLTSIKGFVETLQDGAAEQPALRKKFLDIIETETLRLQRLIEDLLTLSRIENKVLRAEPTSKVSFVQEAFEHIKPVIETYAQAKGLQLMVDIPEDLPAVKVGKDLLSQILLNLLENAVKYTPEGSVWLKAAGDGALVVLEFGDTGCGIPAENLPRVFERFYRVDKARSREQGGTGLGLSIAKHIIEGSGGEIHVRSSVGTGTVFTCKLPRA